MIPVLYDKEYHGRPLAGYTIGLLPKWIECSVTEERNGEYFLEGTLPAGALNVDELAIDRIITAAPAPGKRPQPFRIRRITKPGDADEIHVLAHHVSYQLTENIISPNFSRARASVQDIFDDAFNSGLTSYVVPPVNGVFYFESNIVVQSPITVDHEKPMSVRAFLGGEDGSIQSLFGGEFEWDGWEVILNAGRGSIKNISVEYAKNMEMLEYDTNADGLITGFYGWWLGQNGMYTSCTVYAPNVNDWQYARIEMVDLSSELEPPEGSDRPTQEMMLAATQAYADASTANRLPTSITVTAVPDVLQGVYLCDQITVIHPVYKIKQGARIVKTVFDPIGERYVAITIGDMKKGITDTIAAMLPERNKRK